MRKFLLLLLALTLLLAACAAQETPEPSEPPSSPASSSSHEESSVLVSSQEEVSAESSLPAEEDPPEEVPPLTMTQVSTITDNFLNVSDFKDFLAGGEKYALIPGLKEGIVPQGMGRHPVTGYVYISAYFTTENTPSVILVLDEKGSFVAEYHMYKEDGTPYTGHMGGVCVTEEYLYFSGPGVGDYYGIGEIALADLPKKGAHDVTFTSVVPLPIHASYLFYDQGNLWAGTFYLSGSYDMGKYFNQKVKTSAGASYGGFAAMFPVDENGRLTVPEGSDYAVPTLTLATVDKVQGFTCRDGKVTLSVSYGRNNNSTLYFHSIDPEKATATYTADGKTYPMIVLDDTNRVKKVTAMGMTEGITLDEKGNVLILFESGAQKYYNAKNPTDCVWRFPFPEE
ncbi:MAG: hypothetical protein E7651_01930 [Ruminococcaceae bacterium]|nr:hypothetical protein [Oscillospiraceae bacterium]